MFGNKGILKRVTRAVEAALEPGETLVVPVYLHDPHATLPTLLLGVPVMATMSTWIVALTDRRVLVFEGNNMNAARSKLIGDAPRDAVQVVDSDKGHLVLRFHGDEGHRFTVPLVWRKEAARFAEELRARAG